MGDVVIRNRQTGKTIRVRVPEGAPPPDQKAIEAIIKGAEYNLSGKADFQRNAIAAYAPPPNAPAASPAPRTAALGPSPAPSSPSWQQQAYEQKRAQKTRPLSKRAERALMTASGEAAAASREQSRTPGARLVGALGSVLGENAAAAPDRARFVREGFKSGPDVGFANLTENAVTQIPYTLAGLAASPLLAGYNQTPPAQFAGELATGLVPLGGEALTMLREGPAAAGRQLAQRVAANPETLLLDLVAGIGAAKAGRAGLNLAKDAQGLRQNLGALRGGIDLPETAPGARPASPNSAPALPAPSRPKVPAAALQAMRAGPEAAMAQEMARPFTPPAKTQAPPLVPEIAPAPPPVKMPRTKAPKAQAAPPVVQAPAPKKTSAAQEAKLREFVDNSTLEQARVMRMSPANDNNPLAQRLLDERIQKLEAEQAAAKPAPARKSVTPGAAVPTPESNPAAIAVKPKSPTEAGTRAVAQRIVNAEMKFVEFAKKQAGLTDEQAAAAYNRLTKEKALKIDAVNGTFHAKHGAFLEPDVLRRAAGIEDVPAPAPETAPVKQSAYQKLKADMKEAERDRAIAHLTPESNPALAPLHTPRPASKPFTGDEAAYTKGVVDKTGMTRMQRQYLGERLREVRQDLPADVPFFGKSINPHASKAVREKTAKENDVQHNAARREFTQQNGLEIQVPGDGKFKIATQQQADTLLQRIGETGQKKPVAKPKNAPPTPPSAPQPPPTAAMADPFGAGAAIEAGRQVGGALKRADELGIAPGTVTPRQNAGSLAIERGSRSVSDFKLTDRFRSPTSVIDAMGSSLVKGTYERRGGTAGKGVSKLITDTQRSMHDFQNAAERDLDAIDSLRERVRKRERKSRAAFDAEFVDLIEKNLDDPARTPRDADMAEALKRHDGLTEGFRQFIIKTRRGFGWDTPDDWGVTVQGYFRHLFTGDVRLYRYDKSTDTRTLIGPASTWMEAQKMAADYLRDNPDAQLVARAQDISGGDSALRVSNNQYWRVVSRLADEVEIDHAQIMEDLQGVIGRKAAKTKWLGALQRRTGSAGFSKEYRKVMDIHAMQVNRWQHLSDLNAKMQPLLENIKSGKGTPENRPMPQLAQEMENHLRDLWGTPKPYEIQAANILSGVPILRNVVATNPMVFRGLSRRLAEFHNVLKLRFNLKSAAINLLQPSTTLLPRVPAKDLAGIYVEAMKPTTQRRLMDLGVLEGGAHIEAGVTAMQRIRRSIPLRATVGGDPFGAASAMNRAVGYLYGEKLAKDAGITDAAKLHENGIAWANVTEFDNTAYNAMPVLRDPAGRLIFQYRGYPVKNLEQIAALDRRGKIKWAGAQLAVGGVKSVTGGAGLVGFAFYLTLREGLKSSGMNEQEAERVAQGVYLGAPALFGADLSGSVGIWPEGFGRTPEEQLVSFVGGPTVGAAVSIAKGHPESLASSYARSIGTVGQMVRGEQPTARVNRQDVPLTTGEAIMQAAGFTPARVSMMREEQGYRQATGLKAPRTRPQRPKRPSRPARPVSSSQLSALDLLRRFKPE